MGKLHRFHLESQCNHVITATWDRDPLFRDRRNAETVVSALQFVRSERAFLLAYAVMPDHVHLVLVPKAGHDISRVMQTVKGYAARVINQRRGVRGRLWQRSFFDRMICDDRQLQETVNYVHMNPVAAGLAEIPEAYQFSSAGRDDQVDLRSFL